MKDEKPEGQVTHMDDLYHKLFHYREEHIYPFHMPGHKRNKIFSSWGFPFEEDITEIEGFDNLHHAEGILNQAQKRISALYGSTQSWYSVNGSTAAVLSMVSAAVKPGGTILMARNCHKSVYHAAFLRNLKTIYVYPRPDSRTGINGVIDPEEIRTALEQNPEISAVVMTSPTYDGIVSDIRTISGIVHSRGVPLLVDEAHGAHFRFSGYFPKSAVTEGADVVAQSFHKTLPALTQTAVLHLCSDRVSGEGIEKYLGMYQTSSPSYILMASLDRCAAFLEKEGDRAFEKYVRILDAARNGIQDGPALKLADSFSCFDYDRSRLLFLCRDGYSMADRFRGEFRLEPEMAAPGYVLMLSSVGDTEEGFQRLSDAVRQINREENGLPESDELEGCGRKEALPDLFHFRLTAGMSITEAMEAPSVSVPLELLEGSSVSGEFAYLYPPGIPILVPGEVITEELATRMKHYVDRGVSLQGLSDHTGKTIRIVHSASQMK